MKKIYLTNRDRYIAFQAKRKLDIPRYERWLKHKREYAARWRKINIEKVRTQGYRSFQKWRKNMREHMNRKKMKPCFDCGIQYNPWVMQFDHLDPSIKKFNISELSCNNTKQLDAEIYKCQVVCANCHAERTHRQLIEKSALKCATLEVQQ